MTNKPKLLLHICCAPDSTAVFERLKDDFDVHGFFYNPNIYPDSEYNMRLKETKKVSNLLGFPLIPSIYDPEDWNKYISGLENEPEGGKRCTSCFEFRLNKTAKVAKENNFQYFATTLTISPHKNSKIINNIGKKLGTDSIFLERDFKKKDGFKRSLELSKKHNLYRQNYCGCSYSIK